MLGQHGILGNHAIDYVAGIHISFSCCLENISEQYKQCVLSSPVDIFYLLAAICSFWIPLLLDCDFSYLSRFK